MTSKEVQAMDAAMRRLTVEDVQKAADACTQRMLADDRPYTWVYLEMDGGELACPAHRRLRELEAK